MTRLLNYFPIYLSFTVTHHSTVTVITKLYIMKPQSEGCMSGIQAEHHHIKYLAISSLGSCDVVSVQQSLVE